MEMMKRGRNEGREGWIGNSREEAKEMKKGRIA